ncbi:hypothetical protein [Tenacibaculum sp. C7A-26P2]|uniref:hypothetical protein n=1 Tax=Tenacibaculum sp. C7A-26P2 TaxID=3447504 RepID=UPI003F82CBE2
MNKPILKSFFLFLIGILSFNLNAQKIRIIDSDKAIRIQADYDKEGDNEGVQLFSYDQMLANFTREYTRFYKPLGWGNVAPKEAIHLERHNIRVDGGQYMSNGHIRLYPDVDKTGDDVISFKNSEDQVMAWLQDGVFRLNSNGRIESIGALNISPGKGRVNEDAIIFRNGQYDEMAKLKDGVFRLNSNGRIESIGALNISPGKSRVNEDAIIFRNGQNNEMAKLKDGVLRLNFNSAIESSGNLSISPGKGNANQDAISFKNGQNKEMARLQDGVLSLNQVRLNITSFPDYVFNSKYTLMPLNELASFIKKHKHLPKIPSEKEVVEQGMDVGFINTMLVEKVEELTLYTIAQEKQITKQKEAIKLLAERLTQIEKRYETNK